ncbi:hypothetical protein LCGC14_2465290 [marine sediment metagenome]|uniref:Uncharacterized protein n=1 Tax=marine sediment metagenome TaxID=412755 RepID=A0A0F9BC12_9ZZZZ
MESQSGVPEAEQNLFNQFQDHLNSYYEWEEGAHQNFLERTGLTYDEGED